MSDTEKKTDKPEQDKVVTRYDRRTQKRKEEEEKDKRQKKLTQIIGIIIAAAVICFIASFPIRTLVALNQTFITIGSEKITKLEFDYNYNTVKNNYMNTYSSYLSYFGLDTSSDLSTQMYSETMTWKDYFEEMTVDNLLNNKALLAEAKAAAYSYDTADEYADYKTSIEEAAAEQGVSLSDFVKLQFGNYATMGRLRKYVEEAIYISAYYTQVSEDKTPSDEEILSYYEENTDAYDSVDYRLTTVSAVLPTEPTELADTTADEGDGADDTEAEEETAYEPSEAEIAAAMALAKEEAEAAEANVASDGELYENQTNSSITSLLQEWLFDGSRKAGDTTVIENTYSNSYYVLAFEKRYLDETPTADVRIIITASTDARTILDEWESKEATEDTFVELVEKYSEDTYSVSAGGLYEAVTDGGMEAAVAEWLYSSDRDVGDTAAITGEDGNNYVLYFLGQNDPEWKLSIINTLLTEIMNTYMEEISRSFELGDPKGNLAYVQIRAQEEADAAAETAEETADETTAASDSTQVTETAQDTAEATETAQE